MTTKKISTMAHACVSDAVSAFYNETCVTFSRLTFDVIELLREVNQELEILEPNLYYFENPDNVNLASHASAVLSNCLHRMSHVVAYRRNLPEMVEFVGSYLRRRNSRAATEFRTALGELCEPIVRLCPLSFQMGDLIDEIDEARMPYVNVGMPVEVSQVLFTNIFNLVRQVQEWSDRVISLNIPVLRLEDVEFHQAAAFAAPAAPAAPAAFPLLPILPVAQHVVQHVVQHVPVVQHVVQQEQEEEVDVLGDNVGVPEHFDAFYPPNPNVPDDEISDAEVSVYVNSDDENSDDEEDFYEDAQGVVIIE